MDKIDRTIISFFKKSENTSLDVFDYSASEFLDKYVQFLSNVSGIDFDDIFDEYIDSFKLKIVKSFIGDTLKKAIIASMVGENYGNSDSTVNFIISMGIDRITREFINRTQVAELIMGEYKCYLLRKDLGMIDFCMENEILRRFTLLRRLDTYKGFYTINDMVRLVLDSVCSLALDLEATDEQLGSLFDGYFYTSTFDRFIETDAPMYSKSKNTIQIFKRYQMRLLIADAYTREASSFIMEEKEETGILEELEDLIERQDFKLPNSKRLRYLIYKSYYRGYTLNELDYLYNILGSEDKIETLKPINPLYFLD